MLVGVLFAAVFVAALAGLDQGDEVPTVELIESDASPHADTYCRSVLASHKRP